MIINHTYGFIFIHVPKAAGTTITRALGPLTSYRDQEIGGTTDGETLQEYYGRRFGLRKHSPAKTVRNIIGSSEWDSYFKFGFVRNPYARLVSSYQFLRSWKGAPKEYSEFFQGLGSVEEFLMSDVWDKNSGPDNLFEPQTYWLCEGAQPIVDFVGKIEAIEAGLATIAAAIGNEKLASRSTAPANQSKPYGPPTWTAASMRRVRERYASDFEIFDYPVDLPDALAPREPQTP